MTYGVEPVLGLKFRGGNHVELALDLYLPKPLPADCPTVVYLHGGGWARGSRADHVQERILPVVRNGVAVAAASYRFVHQAIWPAQLEDAAAAVEFVCSITRRFGLNPRRVAVWGVSAGGHLACMLALTSTARDLLSGTVAWFPPTDLSMLETDPKPTLSVLPKFMQGQWAPPTFQFELIGGKAKATNQRLREASPLHHVDGAAKPMLLLHGDRDPLVPPSQTARFYQKLVDHGTDAAFLIVVGATHEDPQFHTPAILGSVAEFLKNLAPLPDNNLSGEESNGG